MTDTIAEIRARHWELEQLGHLAHDDWASEAHTARAVLLRALDEAQAALQFYADPANHIGHRDLTASVYIETSAVDTDGGEIARAALKEPGQ